MDKSSSIKVTCRSATDALVETAPISGGSATDPNLVVQIAGMDPLRDEGIAYAEALKADG